MDNQIIISTEEYKHLLEQDTRLRMVGEYVAREKYPMTDTIYHLLGLSTKEEVSEFVKTMQNATAANLRRQIDALRANLANLTAEDKTPCAASESLLRED